MAVGVEPCRTSDVPAASIALPLVIGSLAAVATVMTVHGIRVLLPDGAWWQAIWSPDPLNIRQVIFHYSYLPRLVVSLLAGAMLALAGVVFQQVLRNPLAEPATLGVSSGAYLAMTFATLWWPALVEWSPEAVAFAGAGAALLLVFALAAGQRFSPLALILAGLVVGLFCGTVTAVLTLFHREALTSVFLWGSGSLTQNDWSGVSYLLPRFLLGAIIAALLLRPLGLLALGDGGARSLGLSLGLFRVVALLLAVTLSAFVVSAVGMIGFVGLAAPALTRLAGARRLGQRAIWAPLFGAALLCCADQGVQAVSSPSREWPTGIVTAFIGAPLLLWMLPRLRSAAGMSPSTASASVPRLAAPWPVIGSGALALALVAYLALTVGQSSGGWRWLSGSELDALLPLRLPRLAAAASAGAMLAVAGTLMQRLTGNAMASPEVLGISAGASLGVIVLAFAADTPDRAMQTGGAATGAFAALAIMLSLGRKASFSPERMLLAGVALTTVFGALVAMLLASGDPRMSMLLSWMAGSTYRTTGRDAIVACAVTAMLLPAMPLAARWLDILPLGETTARELGVDVARSRLAILIATAILTGAATLIVGPLSFVGLMAPHMARMAGFRLALPQLAGSAVLGALIMV
ncbi:Fe(3+)-hydroxamate ABC transporter permease FhuB, partial [Pseudochelatococcus sp. B33]